MGKPRKGYKTRTSPDTGWEVPDEAPVRPQRAGLIPDYAVYRLYDVADRLLYVGVTRDVTARFKTHQERKSWWPEVSRTTLQLFDSFRGAEDAEQVAIRTENPVYNIAGRLGSGYTLDIQQGKEVAVPIQRGRDVETTTDPGEPSVDHAAIHPDGLVVDGTKLVGVVVSDVVVASRGVGDEHVIVDLRVRIRSERIELATESITPAPPPPVDF